MAQRIQKYLRLQIYTQERTAKLLSLLEFPTKPLRPLSSRVSVKRIAQGVVSRQKNACLSDLLHKWNLLRHNQIEVKSVFTPASLAEEIAISEIEGSFFPSPHSSIWAPTDEWANDDGNRAWQEAYDDAVRSECVAKEYEMETNLDLLFKLESSLDPEELQMQLLPILAQSFPKNMLHMMFIGGGGAMVVDMVKKSPLYFVYDAKTVVTERGMNPFFNSFGERFAVLQPIMFGPSALCLALQQALGPEVIYYPIGAPDRAAASGMLHLPHHVLADPKSYERASDYLACTRPAVLGLKL